MHGRESEAVDESKGTAPKAMKQMSLNGAPLGMGKESPSCSEGETNLKGQTSLHMEVEDDLYSALSPIQNLPPINSPERREDAPNNPVPAGPAAPVPPAVGITVLEPAPAPTENFQPEERPLTQNEERRLENALNKKNEISDLLRDIAIEKGEDFAEETNSDLVEAALGWKDCFSPEKLYKIKRSLEFHRQESSY